MPERIASAGKFVAVIIFAALAGGVQWACTSPPSSQTEKGKPMEQEKLVAVIETTLGTIEAELYPLDAPKTVENFVGLAGQNYFNGVIFHRVVPGFVIQGGDPTGTYKTGYMKGVLAMANRGPNTNTSQFFIMLEDNRSLPKSYTIFGRVIKGMDVVDAIGAVPLKGGMGPDASKPVTPVVMKEVRIQRPGALPAKN
jgi:cyclophilin family peptidyl-prolyl cis-trans isomerase